MAEKKTEILVHEHNDFVLYVYADNLDTSRRKLRRTYESRGLVGPACKDMVVLVGAEAMLSEDGCIVLQPFFFENRQYWFEVDFTNQPNIESYAVNHKHALFDQSFSAHPKRKVLNASINFSNDVGLCRFDIQYSLDGVRHRVPVTFTVFATKMIQTQDLSVMNHAIDQVYPLWRYAITGKTTHQQGKSARQPEKFGLFWLAQFERLVSEFNQGVKRVLNAPHNRLQAYTDQQKLERINKRLGTKLEERAKELVASKRASRLAIKKQRLNIDTPENRFIKMVLLKIKANLSQILMAVIKDKDSKVSKSFISMLEAWRDQIGKYTKHKLWKEVGEFKGQNTESKVLQEAAGYSKVYQVWQQLKHYLNGHVGDSQISIKSVADIYEIWCFLEVKSAIESLGFTQLTKKLSHLKQIQFEKQFPDDEMAAAFVYFRESDGMTIEIAHKPSFTQSGTVNRTWLGRQSPDIVLRVTLANHESFFILFDAKYRIDTQQFKDKDGVPEDALNQMHRYRDAIIHQHRFEYESPLKSRPVMGAFALYPGFFDNQKDQVNPYEEAIKEIGIGAFALLPSKDSEVSHNHWLRDYLTQKLCDRKAEFTYPKIPSNDYYFVEDAARITPYGVNTVRHNGLTMIAPINEIERDDDYLEKARTGKLQGYHTQLVATNRQNVHRNIVREIRYVIVTVREKNTEHQVGKYLYRVADVKLLPRHDIDRSLTGKESTDNRHYWLFEFVGSPIALSAEIEKPYVESFQFKLTKAEYLSQFAHWDDVKDDLQLYAEFDLSW